MCSTMQSVVFSLSAPLPSMLSTDHSKVLFFFSLLCFSCQTFHIPDAGCTKQHPAAISEKHRCTQPQGTRSNLSIASSVMQDGEMEVRTQGSKDPWIYFSIVMLVWLSVFLGIYTGKKM